MSDLHKYADLVRIEVHSGGKVHTLELHPDDVTPMTAGLSIGRQPTEVTPEDYEFAWRQFMPGREVKVVLNVLCANGTYSERDS